MRKISGIILAGGKSRRMGVDKAFLHYDGTSFMEIAVQRLKPFCTEILISSDNPKINIPETLRISDEIKGIGPLGGLYSSLKQSNCEAALVIPIDTPFVNAELLNYILIQSKGFEITVVKHNDVIHPLIGLFRKSVLPALENEIKGGHYKIQKFIDKTNFQLLNTDQFSDTVFININTQIDYDQIKGNGI